ncbi:SDR family oxidoreductase [Amycolatopsis sp. 195334CR]|uniref:SDR family oxidoreductase n=1 Tax=Amycolatopsis sp. 195334CR TaxID=2814588 RepID=UPI001A8D9EF3|nr:SDR family oxidoreductase [Amycolatopsis sp. 195334CR]MBN6035816.1 SDR family oxidoreductase [Amycolatopsis sp. 195334CR]
MSVVIVTGGSRGIGAEICVQAAAGGYDVVVNYAGDAAAAADVVSRVEALGQRALAVRGDVSSEPDVLALFEAAVSLGPLYGLVNNAGVVGRSARLEDQDVDTVRRVMDVNVVGVFLCCREAVRRMADGGAIVNVTSTAARLGSAGEWVHYAASKAAVETLTFGLAQEVAAAGIRVNAVAPGLVNTGFHATAGVPDRISRLGPAQPMGRAGDPAEIAAAVVWLLSPAASYASGAVLPISGGR